MLDRRPSKIVKIDDFSDILTYDTIVRVLNYLPPRIVMAICYSISEHFKRREDYWQEEYNSHKKPYKNKRNKNILNKSFQPVNFSTPISNSYKKFYADLSQINNGTIRSSILDGKNSLVGGKEYDNLFAAKPFYKSEFIWFFLAPFNVLSFNLRLQILDFLSPKEVMRLVVISKEFQELVKSANSYWDEQYDEGDLALNLAEGNKIYLMKEPHTSLEVAIQYSIPQYQFNYILISKKNPGKEENDTEWEKPEFNQLYYVTAEGKCLPIKVKNFAILYDCFREKKDWDHFLLRAKIVCMDTLQAIEEDYVIHLNPEEIKNILPEIPPDYFPTLYNEYCSAVKQIDHTDIKNKILKGECSFTEGKSVYNFLNNDRNYTFNIDLRNHGVAGEFITKHAAYMEAWPKVFKLFHFPSNDKTTTILTPALAGVRGVGDAIILQFFQFLAGNNGPFVINHLLQKRVEINKILTLKKMWILTNLATWSNKEWGIKKLLKSLETWIGGIEQIYLDRKLCAQMQEKIWIDRKHREPKFVVLLRAIKNGWSQEFITLEQILSLTGPVAELLLGEKTSIELLKREPKTIEILLDKIKNDPDCDSAMILDNFLANDENLELLKLIPLKKLLELNKTVALTLFEDIGRNAVKNGLIIAKDDQLVFKFKSGTEFTESTENIYSMNEDRFSYLLNQNEHAMVAYNRESKEEKKIDSYYDYKFSMFGMTSDDCPDTMQLTIEDFGNEDKLREETKKNNTV